MAEAENVVATAGADIAVEARNDRSFVGTSAAVEKDCGTASCHFAPSTTVDCSADCIAVDIGSFAAAAAAVVGNYRNLPAESCTLELIGFEKQHIHERFSRTRFQGV